MEDPFGVIDCKGCGKAVSFTSESVIVVWYKFPVERNPFQHFIINCKCGARIRYFTDDADIRAGIYAGCSTAHGDYPDDEVIAGWYIANHIDRLEPVEITKRHELEIQNLHVVLESIPDDLLIDMFTTPAPPKERPERWT